MEILRGVCSDPLLLRSIFARHNRQDKSTNVFQDMMSMFGNWPERPQLVGSIQGGRESLDYGTGGPGLSVNVLTMIIPMFLIQFDGYTLIRFDLFSTRCDKTDSPPIPETYIYYLSLICFNSIAEGLVDFVLPIFSAVSKQTPVTASIAPPSPSISAPQTPHPRPHPHHKDFILVHCIVRAYQNFTNVCGALKLTARRLPHQAAVPAIPIFSSPADKITGSSTSLTDQ
ncbi:LOW QUALITY PROTEIN: hypothetical protein BC936DRAFT_147533 [Jimgerdemannia flammicorona]|uniref:Uncharacterized protein n=1 Tax=Jimgerdemannia flammicorona TaxID=994334 RepID=A0A433D521_9FUNG|nr:LOW QUALITY PROTEIN: hypothetical protein BC936DRAFT_147533 [Jimgerdemannia flammicorona]